MINFALGLFSALGFLLGIVIISAVTYHICRLAFLLFWFIKNIVMKDGEFKDINTGA